MPTFRPDEDAWPLYQAIGTWAVAMTITLFETFGRHFTDPGALPFAALLLGVPVVINVDRQRRKRQREDDAR